MYCTRPSNMPPSQKISEGLETTRKIRQKDVTAFLSGVNPLCVHHSTFTHILLAAWIPREEVRE
jgi:hypothetical protein